METVDNAAKQYAAISVVIPMFNAAHMIEECLAPLLDMQREGTLTEIIVVNDASTDRGSALVEEIQAVKLLHTERQSGPALARNIGAKQASGDYLWFVDADVILSADAAAVAQKALRETGASAIIGAYDTQPRAQNFFSQYKNLVHHYYHNRSSSEIDTFWSGCGLVQRDAFLDIGGFDVERYPYPSVEDIELGYRLGANGHQIRLVKNLNGKHLKEWRLKGLLHTEIFRRAIPWSHLLVTKGHLANQLNIAIGERLRALLGGLWLTAVLFSLFTQSNLLPLIIVSALMLLANGPLITFFISRKGPLFAILAVAFHQIYYAYSSFAFGFVWVQHKLGLIK